MIKYLELDKETLEIMNGPWTAPELPVFADDSPYIAKEVISMPDSFVVSGQVWNDETSSVEDTQTSLNWKARSSLAASDWKVIRELERMHLNGTPLNVEREALRSQVIESFGFTASEINKL